MLDQSGSPTQGQIHEQIEAFAVALRPYLGRLHSVRSRSGAIPDKLRELGLRYRERFECMQSHGPLCIIHHCNPEDVQRRPVNVMDAGDFGPIYVDRAIAVVNDTSGTVAIANGSSASGGGEVVVAAGNSDIVTLRGLTLNGNNLLAGTRGILITNASQVNIEKCRIINAPGTGIFLAPLNGTTVSKINLKIEDTVVTGSGNGLVISSISGLPVNASISRSSFQENTGGGIRIDGQSGGPITVSISDSSSSLNGSAGLNAVSGAGNVAVDLTRAVIASNTTGVQSNQSHGGLVTVTVRGSALLHNVSALVFLGGGTLSSFGDNNIVGTAGTGFSGMTALQ